jgi:tRNA (guanine37-N1)-methyltransferase
MIALRVDESDPHFCHWCGFRLTTSTNQKHQKPTSHHSQTMIVGWPSSWMVALAWMQTSRGFSIIVRSNAALANGIIVGQTRKRNRFGAFVGNSRRRCTKSSTSSSGGPRNDLPTPKFLSSQRWISSTRLYSSSVENDQSLAADLTESSSAFAPADANHHPGAHEEIGRDTLSDNQATNIELLLSVSDEEAILLDDDETVTARKLAENWQDHPSIRQRIEFQSWQVQDGRRIQSILSEAAPYLASRMELLQHTTGKRRVKIVQSLTNNAEEDGDNYKSKIMLIHPDTPSLSDLLPNVTDTLAALIRDGIITQGPMVPVTFTHQDFTVSYILTRLLPVEAHPPPSAFETIGHVAHYNFKRQHLPYRFLIGAVTLSQLPIISTVIHKVGTVQGPYRTYQYELLAGEDRLHVTHTEASCKLEFDIATVYWCSRLSEERQRLIQVEFQPHQIIADAFCGVGALCIQAVRAKQCQILANDWNAAAVQALQHNARLNHVAASFVSITELDAYKFLVDLGVKQASLPHHVVMNYPLEAPKFLGALRWWPTHSDIAPRLHVYTFCESPQGALRQVAEALVPMTDESIFDEDDFASCNVTVHMVRDVTPNTTVACVSFSATSDLLKVVQGDFS